MYVLMGLIGLMIVLAIAGVFRQKVGLAAVLLLWLVMGFHANMEGVAKNPDYLGYVRYYEYAGTDMSVFENQEVEPGLLLIMKPFALLGLSYPVFWLVASLVCLIALGRIINRHTREGLFVFALYALFPFIMDVVQQRNFISMLFVLFSLRFLVEEWTCPRLRFLLCIVLAGLVHTTGFLYMPLVFIIRSRTNRWLRYGFVIVVVLVVIMVVWGNEATESFGQWVAGLFHMEKLIGWFEIRTRLGFMPLVAWIVAVLVLLSHARKRIKTLENAIGTAGIGRMSVRFVEVTQLIQRYSLLFIPLFFFNTHYMRLIRNLLPVAYIAFAISIEGSPSSSQRRDRWLYAGFAMALLLGFVVLDDTNRELLLRPVIENNYVVQVLR